MATVDDLRVKLCYICHDEELYNNPSNPPRKWVHPCKCTLVAHESCLLDWIRASEKNPSKKSASILRCAQCGGKYEIESKKTRDLNMLLAGRSAGTFAGISVTLLSGTVVVASIGAGIYFSLVSYGEFALERFLGKEMATLILGENIDQWPLQAFLQLPLIPLSLILSQTEQFRNTLPLTSIMMFWPSSPPNEAPRTPGSFSQWIMGAIGLSSSVNLHNIHYIQKPAIANTILWDTVRDFVSWPPSPLVFAFGIKVVRKYYSQYMERFRNYVLGNDTGTDNDQAERGPGRLNLWNMVVELNIVEEPQGQGDRPVERAAAEAGERQRRRNIPDNQDRPVLRPDQWQDDNNVRLVLEMVDQPPQQADAVDAPRDMNAANVVPMNAAEALENVPREDAANDEQGGGNIRGISTASALCRKFGGALMIPPIASIAGKILLHLALGRRAHESVGPGFYGSPFSVQGFLRRFLAIRPPNSAPRVAIWQEYVFAPDISAFEALRASAVLAARIMLIGSPAWRHSDPVWWRNTLGLGLVFVARDLLTIRYQYITLQERRSRRVKDKPFEGIDLTELDLRPDFQPKNHD